VRTPLTTVDALIGGQSKRRARKEDRRAKLHWRDDLWERVVSDPVMRMIEARAAIAPAS
jgi:hypothetical protein